MLLHDESAPSAMRGMLALEPNDTGGRRLQVGDDAQQRGLATAARSDDAEELVDVHGERDVGERDDISAIAGERLADVLTGEVPRATARRVHGGAFGDRRRYHALTMQPGFPR